MKTARTLILSAFLCSACTPADSRAEDTAAPVKATSAKTEQTQGAAMQLTINNHMFTAELADTAAAQELRRLLPLTLNMQDHLDNEKHAPLPQSLTRNDIRPGRIETGDILLWQGDTIVVFYESFNTPYRYTRLGKIRESRGLKQAVGKGAVNIRFVAE